MFIFITFYWLAIISSPIIHKHKSTERRGRNNDFYSTFTTSEKKRELEQCWHLYTDSKYKTMHGSLGLRNDSLNVEEFSQVHKMWFF